MSRNKNGRVRCGRCYKVLFSNVRRSPTAAELRAARSTDWEGLEVAERMETLTRMVGFDQPHHDRLTQTVTFDADDNIAGFYCTKCSIAYEPPNLGDRLAEHTRLRQDLILLASDIKTRRA